MSQESNEVEVALLIAADDAPEIAARIARLTHLAGHVLVPREDARIHDVHYDTAEHALRSKGLALRTRIKNGKQLITLKGPARSNEWGAVSRLEIEEAWSEQGLRKVMYELERQQISIDATTASIDSVSPADVMRSAGLIATQDRHTLRHIREVIAPEDDVLLAEFAIDEVTYHFADAHVNLFEIELEAKHRDGPAALRACAEALRKDFGAMLRPWPSGKLATGAAIENLLLSGELTPLLINNVLVGARASLLLEDSLRQ